MKRAWFFVSLLALACEEPARPDSCVFDSKGSDNARIIPLTGGACDHGKLLSHDDVAFILQHENSWQVRRRVGRAAARYADPGWIPYLEALALEAYVRRDSVHFDEILDVIAAIPGPHSRDVLMGFWNRVCDLGPWVERADWFERGPDHPGWRINVEDAVEGFAQLPGMQTLLAEWPPRKGCEGQFATLLERWRNTPR